MIYTPISEARPALIVMDNRYACPKCGQELELQEVLYTPELLFRYECSLGHIALVEAYYQRARLPQVGVN